jgi:protein TonB
VKPQARAYGISLGIHAVVFSFVLAVGALAPRTRAVVLDFSIDSAWNAGAAAAPKRHQPPPERKTVTPTAQAEQAVPVRKEQAEAAPQPVSEQPMTADTTDQGRDSSTASSGSSEAAKEAFISAHFRYIRDKIFRNLGYPAIARRMGWAGKVIVAFTVCADGSVEDVFVVESSGFPVLDRNAVETVKKSCPLPKPPQKTALLMPVSYRLE